MISGYSDHAANERTFLAWVRTGIAMIAFGFVIEKFNLFLAGDRERGPRRSLGAAGEVSRAAAGATTGWRSSSAASGSSYGIYLAFG
jgi:putative membrane protein